MNPFVGRKLAELAATLLILIPSALLLAWESSLPGAKYLWAVMMCCTGVFLYALYTAERRKGEMTFRKFIGSCGGFCLMFLFLLYKTVSVFI